MSWIMLEGLDRSGKSTVAGYYKKQGYDVVHMSAPSKKYFEPGYAGPSYLEEMVEMYNIYAGKDVVFDRTCYGELVWPDIFGRMPLLNDEDFEYLQQLEYNQGALKYMMHDENTEAHWKRCSANNEPINRVQFVAAGRLYDKLADERGFERKQLGDFAAVAAEVEQTEKQRGKKTKEAVSSKNDSSVQHGENTNAPTSNNEKLPNNTLSMEDRLDRANAIKSLLSTKIIKKKDAVFADLEEDIRSFLREELSGLFTEKPKTGFTESEIAILKGLADRVKSKME